MSDTLRRAIEDEGGLVTVMDLAREWGVSKSRVRQIVEAPDFPACPSTGWARGPLVNLSGSGPRRTASCTGWPWIGGEHEARRLHPGEHR
jgi:hypothetical protein